MLTIELATNPVYTAADGSVIDLKVKFKEFEEFLPFSATNYDSTDYGRELYQRAKDGEFGDILPYIRPTFEQVAAEVRAVRDALLMQTDWTQLPDIQQNIKDIWAVYRQALRDITNQTDFPFNVIWPIAPV